MQNSIYYSRGQYEMFLIYSVCLFVCQSHIRSGHNNVSCDRFGLCQGTRPVDGDRESVV